MPSDPILNEAETALRRVFGHEGFRGRQAEIIAHVLRGGSGLVLMPTGGGKSLCYQVPALCLDGLTVVV
ncbi:MAG: ATP-dependent DNA helicase RecQ, partial [Alphaproteobacteria bacterium]|nr:ATP-dependent DNA helicase RecQ [Alphaproteobacteria bacterium]